jgi:hypothetical protein
MLSHFVSPLMSGMVLPDKWNQNPGAFFIKQIFLGKVLCQQHLFLL